MKHILVGRSLAIEIETEFDPRVPAGADLFMHLYKSESHNLVLYNKQLSAKCANTKPFVCMLQI